MGPPPGTERDLGMTSEEGSSQLAASVIRNEDQVLQSARAQRVKGNKSVSIKSTSHPISVAHASNGTCDGFETLVIICRYWNLRDLELYGLGNEVPCQLLSSFLYWIAILERNASKIVSRRSKMKVRGKKEKKKRMKEREKAKRKNTVSQSISSINTKLAAGNRNQNQRKSESIPATLTTPEKYHIIWTPSKKKQKK